MRRRTSFKFFRHQCEHLGCPECAGFPIGIVIANDTGWVELIIAKALAGIQAGRRVGAGARVLRTSGARSFGRSL